jgi:hypothetical protein
LCKRQKDFTKPKFIADFKTLEKVAINSCKKVVNETVRKMKFLN